MESSSLLTKFQQALNSCDVNSKAVSAETPVVIERRVTFDPVITAIPSTPLASQDARAVADVSVPDARTSYWKIALIVVAAIAIVVVGYYIRMKIFNRFMYGSRTPSFGERETARERRDDQRNRDESGKPVGSNVNSARPVPARPVIPNFARKRVKFAPNTSDHDNHTGHVGPVITSHEEDDFDIEETPPRKQAKPSAREIAEEIADDDPNFLPI
jgi:hypothetical protein